MMRATFYLTLTALLLAGCSEQAADDAATAVSPRGMAVVTTQATTTAVTSTVADGDPTIAPSVQIQSDQLGVYRNSSTLSSVIQGIGAWLLDSATPRNATRKVYLSFSQPIAGSGPNGGNPVAIPSGLYKVHMISKCNLYGTSMWTVPPGATIACPLHVGQVTYAGVTYAVQMNPYTSADPDASYPETNYANITCVVPGSGSGPCTQWRMTPSGTYTEADGTTKYRNVGKLLKYVSSKGKTTAVNQGDFYFSFAIGVTNP